MAPLAKWPEWVKAVLTAAFASIVTVFGMGMSEGARRARADADHQTIEDHGPRITAIEMRLAADVEWKANTTRTLERIEAAVRR